MILKALIRGTKVHVATIPATATLATVPEPQAGIVPTVAGVATLAVAMPAAVAIVLPELTEAIGEAAFNTNRLDLPTYCPTTGKWCSSRIGLDPCQNCEPALKPFECRACGSLSWRQGIESRICQHCQVPEVQHTPVRARLKPKDIFSIKEYYS